MFSWLASAPSPAPSAAPTDADAGVDAEEGKAGGSAAPAPPPPPPTPSKRESRTAPPPPPPNDGRHPPPPSPPPPNPTLSSPPKPPPPPSSYPPPPPPPPLPSEKPSPPKPPNPPPAYPRSSGGAPLFTSNRIPPLGRDPGAGSGVGVGGGGTCGIPFGVVISPFMTAKDGADGDEEDDDDDSDSMALCLACLSYLNPYCPYESETGRWTCSVCGYGDNVAPPGTFGSDGGGGDDATTAGTSTGPSEAVVRPRVEYRQRAAGSDVGRRSDGTGAGGVQSASCVVVVLDGNLPAVDAHSVASRVSSLVESSLAEGGGVEDVEVGLIVFDSSVSVYQLGALSGSGSGSGSGAASASASASASALISADVFRGDYDIASASAVGDKSSRGRKARQRRAKVRADAARRVYFASALGGGLEGLIGCVSAYFGEATEASAAGGAEPSKGHDGGGGASEAPNGPAPEDDPARPLSRREQLRLRREQRLAREKAAREGRPPPPAAQRLGNGKKEDESTKARPLPQTKRRRRKARRCTGEAMRRAVEIASSALSSGAGRGGAGAGVGRPYRTGRILLFTDGCPNRGPGSVTAPPPLPTAAAAAQSARVSQGSTAAEVTRGGAPTPGARRRSSSVRGGAREIVSPPLLRSSVSYFSAVGRAASRSNVLIDAFCGGVSSTSFGVPVYQALANTGGGYALCYNHGLDRPRVMEDVGHVLANTWGSSTVRAEDGAAGDETMGGGGMGIGVVGGGLAYSSPHAMNSLEGCVFDVRCPSFVEPSSAVGPGRVMYGDEDGRRGGGAGPGLLPSERTIFARCASLASSSGLPSQGLPSKSALDTTLTRLTTGRYDPRATFALTLSVDPDAGAGVDARGAPSSVPERGVFQFVSHWSSRCGRYIHTRVHTVRLPAARDALEWLEGCDEEASAVLLGREAVYRSVAGRDDEVVAASGDGTTGAGAVEERRRKAADEEVERAIDEFLGMDRDSDEMFDGGASAAARGSSESALPVGVRSYGGGEEDEVLASEARKDLDATVRFVSESFRALAEGKVSDSSASKPGQPEETATENGNGRNKADSFALPPEILPSVRLLHHLRRSALLGSGPLLSADDRAVHRDLFLRLPLEDGVGMMAPRLWRCEGKYEDGGTIATAKAIIEATMKPFPPATLALWSDSTLAADAFDSLFVWSGRGTTAAAAGNATSAPPDVAASTDSFDDEARREYCRAYLRSLSLSRFPSPQLYTLREGDSMSRRLISRLAPLHGDPHEAQVESFPELATLTEEEIAALRDKFRFYDPTCGDVSFRRWFWDCADDKRGKPGLDGVPLWFELA